MSVEIPAIPRGVRGDDLIAHLNDRLRRISLGLGPGAQGPPGTAGPPGTTGTATGPAGLNALFISHSLTAAPTSVPTPGPAASGDFAIVQIIQDSVGRPLPVFPSGSGGYAADTALRVQNAPINFSGDAGSITLLIFVATGAPVGRLRRTVALGPNMRWVLACGLSGGSAL